MAHKKGVGSTDNGRDSNSKRLGVKLFGGELALAGNIIVRQRGTRFHPGDNVYMGKDFTLHAKVNGTVSFRKKRFNRTFVNIVPLNGGEEIVAKSAPKARAVAEAPVEKKAPVVEKAAPVVKEEPVAAAPVVEAPKEEAKVKKAAAPAKKAAAPAKKEVKAKTSKTEKITLPSGKKIKLDDLKMVEGVGPKIEGLLQEGGIHTWADLANAPTEKVQAILDEAGPRYKMHNPATWAKQAELADAGKWEELETYQDKLKGGREV